MKCRMNEITAKINNRWMRNPALLNMTKPPSHRQINTIARIRNMADLLPFFQNFAPGANRAA
jgi:hypothetical protein